MTKCSHTPREIENSARCYSHSVAVHPYTEVNRAAHGNIRVTEECTRCGHRRHLNINHRHVEYGPWWDYPAERRAELDAAERADAEARDTDAAARRCREAYASRITGTVVTEGSDGDYLSLIRGSSYADEIVIGRGDTRAAALLAGAANADRIYHAVAFGVAS